MLKLSWLGLPCVELDGVKLHFETRKVLALLTYLSLTPKPNPREVLATLFWPEFDQVHALANLRRALGSLTRTLPPGTLEANREFIRWIEPPLVEIDVSDFRSGIAEVRSHSHDTAPCSACLDVLQHLAELYRGDFLEGLNLPDCTAFDEWQYFLREELNREYAWVLEHLVKGWAVQGEFEKAATAARRWVNLDRLDTSARLALVDIYARSGQRSLAQRQYEEFSRIMEDELGLGPDEACQESFHNLINQARPAREDTWPSPARGSAVQTLLKTKLYLPKVRSKRVSRLRLLAHLDDIPTYALTLVSAPAGFGKTSLLAEWAVRAEFPVAWLSLDAGDNDPARFFNYLSSALDSAVEGVAANTQALLESPQPLQPQYVVTVLLNDIDSAGEPLLLVLDDFQFITSQAVHEAVAYLVEHITPNLHLVIASRSDPPLPLARLRARGDLLELRGDDLRFTLPETSEFFNQVMNLDLKSEDVQILSSRTEGWIAGLQMAALSMRDRDEVIGFIEEFSGTNRYILDYLLEEVLSNQSPEIQRFLLHTSILERLAAPLCDALLAGSERPEPGDKDDEQSLSPSLHHSAFILEYLERANLFLVALDDGRVWYRYHHLFADLLRVRLHQTQPDLVPILHIRASAWLVQKGYIVQAIQHLFAAEEMDRAADLIERYAPAQLEDSDPSVLQTADRLPREMILARPKIGLYQAWFFIIQGKIRKALPLLNELARHPGSTYSNSGQAWMQTLITTALAFLSPPAGAPGFIPLPDYLLLDDIPAEEPVLRNAADFLYGMALGRRGELDRAVEVSINCIQREKTSLGTRAIPTLAPFLTRIYLMQGRLHAAASLCREFLGSYQDRGIRFIYTTGSMKIDLGEVLYEWNCLEEAEQLIQDGLQANEPWRNIMTDGFGLVALTRVLQARGAYARAMQVVEKLEERLLEHSQPREFDEDLRTLKVRLQLASGDLQNPSEWADQICLSEDFDLHEEYYTLTLARIRLAQHRYEEVEKLLSTSATAAGVGSQISKQLESNLLLAAAIAGQNRLPEALGLIEASLHLAEREGYIRIFLDVGEPTRGLLADYLRSEAPAHELYAQKLLDAFTSTI
jgi:LuxR family transcriptional regulator, maltose regulon positive regulatory protein